MNPGKFLFLFLIMIMVAPRTSMAQTNVWKVINSQALVNISQGQAPVRPGLTAFIFLSPECPLSKQMVPALKAISSSGSCRLVAVFPGTSYSEKEIGTFLKEFGVNFTAVIDPVMSLTHILQASTTPQAILVSASGKIVYTGLIDDKIISLGKQRKVAGKHYLADAIASQKLGNDPVISKTEPIGCFINDH